MDNHTTPYQKALYGTAIGAMVVVSLSALIYAKSYARSFSPENGWNTISVSAEGKATGIPDVAQVSFSVSTDGKDAPTAQEATVKKMDDITKYLLEQGVEKEDIQTTAYNVYPKTSYECGRAGFPCATRTDGFTVTQEVSVKLRDTAKAGEILGAVVQKGATNTSGPTFVIDDRTKLEEEARGEAIEKAKEKAQVLARQSGIRLGKLISVSDDGSGNGPMPYDMMGRGGDQPMMEMKTSAPNVQPGSQDVRVTVTLTYSIR